ncbi:hypothetical protein AB0C99_26535, partial [Streptomyces sp. NPDC048659]
MTPDQLRAFCLDFNDATEEFPFAPEVSVFKVAGKMFALSWGGGGGRRGPRKNDPNPPPPHPA